MRRIVVVDEFVTDPPLDGGSRSIVDILRTCGELGHEVDLYRSATAFTSAIDGGRRWDVGFLSRPDTTLRCIDAARRACGRVLYLGHDLHHVRLAAEAGEGNLSPGVARAHLALERQCWQRSDLSLYPTWDEVEVVAAHVGPERVAWFPYFRVDRVETPTPRDPAAPLLFLGGAGHLPNVTGMRWFLDEILPRLEGTAPTVEVIGSWPADRRPVSEASLVWLGPRSAEQLSARLAVASAMVVPLRTGAGLKSKVVDALAASTPLVTTSIGVQGIPSDRAVAWVSDRAEEWPPLLDTVWRGGQEVLDRCRNGSDHVRAVYGVDPFAGALTRLIQHVSL